MPTGMGSVVYFLPHWGLPMFQGFIDLGDDRRVYSYRRFTKFQEALEWARGMARIYSHRTFQRMGEVVKWNPHIGVSVPGCGLHLKAA